MGRFLAGGVAALLLVSGGLFMWRGYSQAEQPAAALPAAPPPLPAIPEPAADAPKFGPAPPELPSASNATREERRFNRLDRDRDNQITRIEMMSARTKAFRKLDRDGNNLLTFEEWAAATSDRFAGADADRSATLTRAEFATTAPKPASKAACRC